MTQYCIHNDMYIALCVKCDVHTVCIVRCMYCVYSVMYVLHTHVIAHTCDAHLVRRCVTLCDYVVIIVCVCMCKKCHVCWGALCVTVGSCMHSRRYTCIHAFACVCIHIHMHVKACMYTYTYACGSMYVCVFVIVCVAIDSCTWCISTHVTFLTHTNMYTYKPIYLHTNTHTCMHTYLPVMVSVEF